MAAAKSGSFTEKKRHMTKRPKTTKRLQADRPRQNVQRSKRTDVQWAKRSMEKSSSGGGAYYQYTKHLKETRSNGQTSNGQNVQGKKLYLDLV